MSTTVLVVGAPVQSKMLAEGYYTKLPRRGICPYCQSEVLTQINYEAGFGSHLLCCGLALGGCFCGCCLAPYFVDALKDVVHTCPNCHNKVGVKTLFGVV
jgi:lipopolysaccharide-induced tumor necrosis factor-alpha factor